MSANADGELHCRTIDGITQRWTLEICAWCYLSRCDFLGKDGAAITIPGHPFYGRQQDLPKHLDEQLAHAQKVKSQ